MNMKGIISRNLCILIILLSIVGQSSAQINYPTKKRLNENWLFLRTDLGSIWEAVRPAAKGAPEEVPLWFF